MAPARPSEPAAAPATPTASPTLSPVPNVRLDVWLPTVNPFATPEVLAAVADEAESHGIGTIWVGEHVVGFDDYQSPYPYAADGKMPVTPESGLLEPFTTLAFLAGLTSTVRLGTAMVLLPQRNPVYVAKEVSTLDWLSGGRVDLGVGVGWLAEEFAALDVPWPQRGRRCDEYLEVLRTLWVRRRVVVPRRVLRPRPVPHEPQAHPEAAAAHPHRRREHGGLGPAARAGQGWHTFNRTPDQLAEPLGELDRLLAEAGRTRDEIRITVCPYMQPFDADSSRRLRRGRGRRRGRALAAVERRRGAVRVRQPRAHHGTDCPAAEARGCVSCAGARQTPHRDRQRLHAPQHDVVLVGHRVGGEGETGARRTKVVRATWASMRAKGAPRQWWMPKPNPRWLLGFRPRFRRSGSSKTPGSWLAEAMSNMAKSPAIEGDVAELEVLGDGPPGELHRRHVAQQLLDPGAGHRRVVSEASQLVRLFEQGEGAAGDEVDRGLVTGHEEEDARGQQLAFAEHAALVLGSHQAAQQVVARDGPAARPAARRSTGRTAGRPSLRASMTSSVRRKSGSRPAGQRVRPLLEALLVGHGNAQEIADDPDGQRVGEGLDEIDLAGLEGGIEQLVDDLLGAVAQRLDHPGRERLGDESPQPGVVRWVAEEEGAHLPHGLLPSRSCRVGRRNPAGMRSMSTLRLSELDRLSRRTARQSACRATTQKPNSLRWMGARSRSSAYSGEGVARPLGVEGIEDGPVGLACGHRSRHRVDGSHRDERGRRGRTAR